MAMKTEMVPLFLPTIYKQCLRESCTKCSCKCAHTNTVHAELLMSLAAFIANVKISQVNFV